MKRLSGLSLALALLLLGASAARADRTGGPRAQPLYSPGPRGDIYNPGYITGPNGTQPNIQSGVLLVNPANPVVGPVFNIPYYGAGRGFSSATGAGATDRPPNTLRPR